jgi:hypothetical protein
VRVRLRESDESWVRDTGHHPTDAEFVGAMLSGPFMALGAALLPELGGIPGAIEGLSWKATVACANNPVCATALLGTSANVANNIKSESQAKEPLGQLYRWVAGGSHTDGVPWSKAFKDPQLSVYAAEYGATPNVVLEVMGQGEGAVYAVDTLAALNVPGVTNIAWEMGTTGNPMLDAAHFIIVNNGTPSVAKALRDIFISVLRGDSIR